MLINPFLMLKDTPLKVVLTVHDGAIELALRLMIYSFWFTLFGQAVPGGFEHPDMC